MMCRFVVVVVVVVCKAIMTGNTLPRELDLLNLVLVAPRPGYVIINGRRQQAIPTTTTTTTTRRPTDPQLGSVTFTSGRSYLRLPQWSPGRRGTVCQIQSMIVTRGVDPYGTGGTRPPQYLDWGDIITNVPPIFLE